MSSVFKPRNPALTEHRGSVARIIFSEPTQPFTILLLSDDATVCGEASSDQFVVRGAIYRFFGRWEDHDKRGPRFKFSTFTIHTAHSRAAVVRYLTSFCEGVGEKIASRIYDKFREDSVSTLRSDPARVATECQLSTDLCELAACDLQRGARYEDTKIELFGMFAGRGFHGSKLIDSAIRKWGIRAPQVIRRNPFALLSMPSAGFKRCDRLWTDFKLPPNSLKRSAVVAAHLVKTDTKGHTWLSADDLAAKLREMIPGANVLKTFKLAIRARLLKKYRDVSGKLWLSTYHRATSEERIAAALARLSAAPSLWPTDRIPVSQVEGDKLPSDHQVERLKLATAEPVGMLLGGPGTGKTHITGYLLREVIAEFGRASILACSPTGKAANRMTQAFQLAGIDLTARTIHSTLEIGRNGHDGDGWGFQRRQGNPLDCQFLITDEVSMADTCLMADLLDACGTGTHVLLVGDPNQLPPVGHGAPLRDMIEAAVPHGELTQVRRNAGQIVHACQRIKNGESFEVADKIDLDADIPKNLKLIEARDEKHACEQLMETLANFTKYNPTWQTQVIVARNTKGEICRKKLNELLHPMLNPDGYAVTGNPFKVGDKIICTRNSNMQRVTPIGTFGGTGQERTGWLAENYDTVRDGRDGNQPVEVYVANGEIGRVVAVAGKLTVARFSEGDALVKIPMGKQREQDDEEEGGSSGDEGGGGGGRGCNFDHAYAVTGHKMQGSESPCVIVMGDDQAGMLTTREWIYTAISRAAKLCILIGKMSTFNKMKDRRQLNRRKTFLREQILDIRYAEL